MAENAIECSLGPRSDRRVQRTPEQIEKDHEEIAALREQGERELVKVIDTQIGEDLHKHCSHRYVLADGTVVTHAVGQPKGLKTNLTSADWEEFRSLRNAREGEELGTYEETVQGRVFSFVRQRFVLSDGTEIIRSAGAPTQD